MARLALENLGLGAEEIDRAENVFRDSDSDRMREQLVSGDVRSAREQILTEPARRGEP
jgi:CPA2 family monovalent cation:H+ antiporter-2/glutathione-regulated potassium-efflux system protein KefB